MGKIQALKQTAVTQHQKQRTQVEDLIMELRLLRESYDKLPEAISAEIVERLRPLEDLQQTIDEITQAQRSAIQELATEITVQATSGMEEATEKWNKDLKRTGESLYPFQSLAQNMGKILRAQKTIISRINRLTEGLEISIHNLGRVMKKRGNNHLLASLITSLITISAMIAMPWIWGMIR